MLADYCR